MIQSPWHAVFLPGACVFDPGCPNGTIFRSVCWPKLLWIANEWLEWWNMSAKGTMAIKTNQNYIKVEIPRLGITRLLGIDLGPPSWKQFQSQDRSQSRPWCFNGLDSPQMRHLVTGSCWMETKLFFLDVFGSWLNEKQDEFQTSSGPSSCWVYGKKTNN